MRRKYTHAHSKIILLAEVIRGVPIYTARVCDIVIYNVTHI